MFLPVVFRRKVGRDLAGGYAWYEGQDKGLGEQFLSAVNAAFDAIERYPEMFGLAGLGLAALAVVLVITPQVTYAQWFVPWTRSPSITVVANGEDPRIALVGEATGFWNKTWRDWAPAFGLEASLSSTDKRHIFANGLTNVARNVITHEVGHAIGLGHNADPKLLMCGRPAPCRPGQFRPSEPRMFPLAEEEKQQLLGMYPPAWRPH